MPGLSALIAAGAADLESCCVCHAPRRGGLSAGAADLGSCCMCPAPGRGVLYDCVGFDLGYWLTKL